MDETAELKPTQAQEWFINALLKLMQTKPFAKIQIKELSKKADLDRRTFYRYFKSKDDVLELYCGLIMQDFAKKILEKSELSLRTVVI
ncbi:MAG TPA: TetR/AcrR family transcriptional regulator, partial [Patescibacteria group bacterium]|nr:TetR/AcrR family transcriptional regulator [Patescibacteria group bacterium]